MKRTFVVACLAMGALGCGEELPDPRTACAEDGVAMYASIDVGGAGDVRASASVGDGLFQTSQLYVRFEDESGEKYIVRFRASDGDELLLDRVAGELRDRDSVSLTIVDASDPGAGSGNVSGLDRYECSFADGAICGQVAHDVNGDGLISDDDEVYNGISGTLRVTEASGLPSRYAMDWEFELGGNVVAGESGAGSTAGCVATGYSAEGSGTLVLD